MADDKARVLSVEIDGKAHEVQIPEGWVSEDDLRESYMPKEMFRKELAKQVRDATKGLAKREDLLDDDGFIAELLEAKRDELVKKLGVKAQPQSDEQAEKLLARLREKEVQPLTEKLSALETETVRWRDRARDADIAEAFDATGVADDYRDLIKLWARERMQYDGEQGVWVVLDDDGEPDFSVGENGKPKLKQIADLLREVRKSGKKPGWFSDETRPGVGYKGDGGKATAPSKKVQDMSEEERKAYIREHGYAKFAELLQASRKKAA